MESEGEVEKENEAKIEFGDEMIVAGLENIGDQKQHKEAGEGMLMSSTEEIIASASAMDNEVKAAENLSDDSSTSIETFPESELSESKPTKQGSKRKRNRYRNKKWILTPALNGNGRQPIVAKRKLAKVKECLAETPSKIETDDSAQEEKGSGDIATKDMLENGLGHGENINKVGKKFWQTGFILPAFGRRRNDSVVISGSETNLPQGLKPLVHNSGIIQRKLERLRSMVGIRRAERVEPLQMEVADKKQEASKNPDVTPALGSSGLKAEHSKNEAFNPSKVQPKSKVSFLLPFLSAFNGKVSVDPPDIGKVKSKVIEKSLPPPLRRRADVETWISGGQPCRVRIVPYLAHYPYWAGLKTDMEFLNDSALFVPRDLLSGQKKIVKDSDSSLLNSLVGSQRLTDGAKMDSISMNNSNFSYVDSDLDLADDDSLDGKGTCFSSIRKRLQGWGGALRGRLNRLVSENDSEVNTNLTTGSLEEPKTPTESSDTTKKRIRGKIKANKIVIPIRLKISAIGRSINLGQHGLVVKGKHQSISDDDNNWMEEKRKD